MHAAEPITVTKTEYIQLSGTLLAPIEAAYGVTDVWSNGGMYSALVHDSRWLTTCKGQIDGIRDTYAAQAARNAGKPPATPAKKGSQ